MKNGHKFLISSFSGYHYFLCLVADCTKLKSMNPWVVTSIVQSLYVSSAHALTRYFNCVTRIANGNGTMSLDNVKGCYYKVFQGARDADADGHKIK